MANRLTDTTIWKNQKWFKKLPVLYKLSWKYLTDVCDQAGIWKIDLPQLIDDLGIDEFDLPDFLKQCNYDLDKKTGMVLNRKRVLQFDDNHIWLTGFMAFQYGGKTKVLQSGNLSIVGSKKILEALNLWELGIKESFFCVKQSPLKPLEAPLSPLKPLEGDKDKDKDKDNKESISISKTPIGSEKVQEIARTVWGDEIWRNNICMGGSIQPEDLKKWMAQFNASVCNDAIHDFTASSYKKMIQGWIKSQKSKGVIVNGTHLDKSSNAAPLKRY